ncbi:hypothetical protein [Nocardia cyriacigeorgica]|uniref:Uncharacterized protein n=1 Tax=Nocardia cyriacigeorgica (strain GUH-2) TaxID=1127134 RepID=H6R459_NOCCG|nr:hypothetical protein [Nocardia cyriacigeorgica]TLF57294.1 hypothetical protein FEK31_14335 [Nocardia cyriacigeorgica]CCF65773.1 protein of unknown function [Nocardia cyriacigeorgica GUH-2]
MFDHSPSRGLTIGSWVVIGDECSVRRAPLADDDYVGFVFDSGGSEFELALSPCVLRRMADLARDAGPQPGRVAETYCSSRWIS